MRLIRYNHTGKCCRQIGVGDGGGKIYQGRFEIN